MLVTIIDMENKIETNGKNKEERKAEEKQIEAIHNPLSTNILLLLFRESSFLSVTLL